MVGAEWDRLHHAVVEGIGRTVSSLKRIFLVPGPLLVVAGAAGAAFFTLTFPEVKGLGSGVRLPVFHGGLTWVNLMLFVALAAVAIAYLASRRESLYSWVESVRWVAIGLWLVGSVLGLVAALNTWDFTGSNENPLVVVSTDARLMAQAWTLVLAIAIVALAFLVDEKRLLAGVDVGFVVVTLWILGRAVLGPGRALHPDSPVLNSPELRIKLAFAGIVVSQAVAVIGVTWWLGVMRARGRSGSGEPAQTADKVRD